MQKCTFRPSKRYARSPLGCSEKRSYNPTEFVVVFPNSIYQQYKEPAAIKEYGARRNVQLYIYQNMSLVIRHTHLVDFTTCTKANTVAQGAGRSTTKVPIGCLRST